MGAGRRQGRPEASAAAVAAACTQLVESVRAGDSDAFASAAGRWCDAVLVDASWAVWLWREAAGFELRAQGGLPPPPQASLDAFAGSLRSDATRRELATGRPVLLDAASSGPETSAAAVAFGSPSRLLAVLVMFHPRDRGSIAATELDTLVSAARLCAVVQDVEPVAQGTGRGGPPHDAGARLQPTLLAEMRAALTAVAEFAHTLIHSEHRLGRVDRRGYHEVIERQALSLAGTVDDMSLVGGAPLEAVAGAAPGPVDGEQFTAAIAACLGPGVEVGFDPAVAAVLPPRVDARMLAGVVAGLVRVAGASGSRVDVTAAASASVARIGVAAVVGAHGAARLVALVHAVEAGDADLAWSGRAQLAIAAAVVAARTHGGSLGATVDGEAVRVWLDLPLAQPAP